MKKYLLVLISIMIISFLHSCNKNDDLVCGLRENTLLFKYKDDSYANYVTVIYSSKKNKVVGYPDSSEPLCCSLIYHARKCSNGYYITTTVGTNSCCMTNITVNEYKEIWKATEEKDIRDTLTSRVIDRDPCLEIYKFPNDSILLYDYLWNKNLDKINEMIESGELFTYEGVERVK